jgi:hypothetical protein
LHLALGAGVWTGTQQTLRPHLKPANKSDRIDETYIKVKGSDKYLYRAADSTGQTIDFLLTAKRDKAAAKRFLRNAIEASGNAMPRVMNVDKKPSRSGYGGGTESRRRASSPGRFTSVQISQQRDRTGSPNNKETSVAGQGLRLLSERLADVAGNRSGTHDPQGTSEDGWQKEMQSAKLTLSRGCSASLPDRI